MPGVRTHSFKIFLLLAALLLVVALLLYSQHIIDQLLDKEREVVDLYARSYEYIASDQSSTGDFTFLFDEVIRAIDFPVILTDAKNTPIYWKNLDTSGMGEKEREHFLRRMILEMDQHHRPIRVAVDTMVLNYIHYGESDIIRRLRWLPFIEISLATVFILIAYLGFSHIKKSEQSNIWVGMAKETAHQLGTPLSSIMGWLELLKSEDVAQGRFKEAVAEMATDVDRLNKVTARFSKIGSRPDLREENLTEVIQGVIGYFLRRMPRDSVQISVEPDTALSATINRELFEWVVENLIKNALDALEGSHGKITFRMARFGHRTTIDVIDTGKGIDPKHYREIFKPGFSTKKRGWGLGLSLSKRIIEDYHKGKMYVKQSERGVGTTFRIRLVT